MSFGCYWGLAAPRVESFELGYPEISNPFVVAPPATAVSAYGR